MKRLVVTADDFGAAREVNEAVETAHRDGILTAASLMVSGPAAADAIERARRNPRLRVGLHLVLVEGRPVLSPGAIPDLLDARGNFRTDMAAAGAAMFFIPRVRRQLAAEIAAQFESFRATGLTLDHVNAHKHFHLHPTIAGLVARIGRPYGLRAARVPLEPGRVLSRLERGTKSASALITLPWAHLLRRRFRAAGILTPDSVFGLRWSGAMTPPRLVALLRHLPEGLNEIYLHPATAGNFAGAAPHYRYRDEMEALIHPATIACVRGDGLRLGGFTDFLALDRYDIVPT